MTKTAIVKKEAKKKLGDLVAQKEEEETTEERRRSEVGKMNTRKKDAPRHLSGPKTTRDK